MSRKMRVFAFALALIMILTSTPIAPVSAQTSSLAAGLTNPFDKNISFSLNGKSVKSNSYRIPSMVTLADGTIVAAADIRWNTTYDGGGLDTLVARSTDGGATWTYNAANYLGDNGNEYNYNSTTFIDPSLLVAADGMTVYMLTDLYAYGVALNGLWNTNTDPFFAYPEADTGFDANGNLKLSSDGRSTFGYYLSNGQIYANGTTDPVEGFSVDPHFNITYTKDGETVKSNLFFEDSPFKVARTQFLYLTKSTDGGATWSAPTLLNLREPAGTTAKDTDEDALLVSPGNAITTTSGIMVYPVYSYAHYTNSTSVSNSYQHMGLIYSTDGVNWERTENFTGMNFSSEGTVIELENGNLRVFFRNDTGYLCYVDYDLSAKSWGTYVKTEIPVNSNTQLSAITYSKTSNGRQVVLVSCPTGPNGKGSSSGDGSQRSNGKIHVFTVSADGSMNLENTVNVFDKIATGALSGSNYTEADGFFAYSSLEELSDGSIALLYENNQIGWGYGENKYYTITNKGFSASVLGIKLDRAETVVVDGNGNYITEVTVSPTDKAELIAKSLLATADVDYQWQIEYGENQWVDIYGENEAELTLSFGMVATLLDDDGDVYVRCVSTAGTKTSVSGAIKVHVDISSWEDNNPDGPSAPTLSILRDGVNAESVTTTFGNNEFTATLSAVTTLTGSLIYNWEVLKDAANDIWSTLTTEDTCIIGFKDLVFKYYDASTDYATVRLTVSNGTESLTDTFIVYRNANINVTNSTGGEAVDVTVSGVLPEDANLQLGDASDTTIGGVEEDEIVLALDVSITQNGAEWQPAEGETVRVSIPAYQLGLVDGQYFTVYHIHDGTTELLGPFVVDNGYITFDIDGFSVVVITTNYGAAIGAVASFANPVFVLGDSPEDFAGSIVYRSDFPVARVAIKDFYFDAFYGQLYYEIDAAPGYTWPEAYADSHWCYSEDLSHIDVNGEVGVFDANGNCVTEVAVSTTDPVTVGAVTSLQSGQIDYQWQICYDVANDLWVDINGQTSVEISLNAGMIFSLLDENNQALVRVITTVGSKSVISDPVVVTLQAEDSGETEDPTLEILCNGESADSVDVIEAEKDTFSATLSASTDLLGELTYSWEVLSDPSNGVWDVLGTDATFVPCFDPYGGGAWIRNYHIHYVDETTSAITVRLTVANGMDILSDTFTINLVTEAAASSVASYSVRSFARSASNAKAAADGETTVTYNVIIEYLNQDGTATMADPYTSTVSPTTILTNTVSFPKIPGYVPMVYQNGKWVRQDTFTFDGTPFTGNFTLKVHYFPDVVNYRVNIYIQNAENDEYTLMESYVKQELTGTVLDKIVINVEGYYQSKFSSNNAEIAADGSTVFDLYYDRIYYLMKFDLDGGYGVEPIYARHGVRLDIPNPTRAGYSFVGWDQTAGTPADPSQLLNDGIANTMYTNMPIGNTTYKAIWKAAENAKVTIVYWGENPNDEKYSYLESQEIYVKPGTELTFGTDQRICTLTPHTHGNGCSYDCGKTPHTHSEVNSCYSDKVICQIESHNHAQTGCTLNCNHQEHDLSCYSVTSGKLTEANKPSENLTNVGNGIYTYTSWAFVTLTHYYLNIGDKWYTSDAEWYDGGDTNAITLSCTHGHTNVCWSCGLNEGTHVHSVAQGCYERTCTTEEHTHNDECYSCIAHTHDDDCYLKSNRQDATKYYYVRSDTVTVAADGSTVMNVYYDRVEYSVKFYSQSNLNTSNEYTDYRITAKWGANILSQWPKHNGSSSWYVPNKDNTWQNSIQIMPVGGANFYGPKTGNSSYSAYYYVEALPSDTDTFQHNGVTYKLHHTDTSVSSGNVTDEERYGIEGFKYKEGTSNGTSYNNAKFYYVRENYLLEFNNGEDIVKTHNVKYQYDLDTYDFIPTAPSKYEAGSVVFGGWYQNPECTGEEVKLDEMTMPASHMILYAKWVPVKHDVTFYRYRDADGNLHDLLCNHTDAVIGGVAPLGGISHGDQLNKHAIPEKPTNGNYTFVTWAYYDEERGKEVTIDIDSFVVTKDVQIYAKWSSNVQIPYTIKYVDQATGKEIAPPTEGKHYAGETYTFNAKTGAQLNADYQEGYFPTITSHSIAFKEEDNSYEYIFYYVNKGKLPYTVYYVTDQQNAANSLQSVTINENGEDKTYYIVAATETVETAKAIVTETFKKVQGYMPDAYQKTLILSGEQGVVNQIIFKYSVNTTQAYYKVTHYTQQLDGSWYEHSTYENIGSIGDTINELPMDISGFTYDHTDYVVNGKILEGVDANKGTNLTADGLDIKLYYTRNKYSYTVEYREQGTDKLLYTVPNLEPQYYGATVSYKAPQYWQEGNVYERFSPETQSIVIQIDEKNEGKNLIVFYYVEREVTINYVVAAPGGGVVNPTQETVLISSGVAQGSTAEALPGYRFVGWFDQQNNKRSEELKFVPQKVNDLNVAATYCAKFEEIPVTIKYVVVGPNGVDPAACGTVTPEQETLGAATGAAKGSTATASSSIYKFVGWYTKDASGNYVAVTDADGTLNGNKFTPTKAENALWVDGTTYYAMFEYNLTSLTITKAFPDGADYSIDENQSFVFSVMEYDAQGRVVNRLEVTIHGQGSVTIDGLTVGNMCVITEKTDWSWRYGACKPEGALGLNVTRVEDSSITVTLTHDAKTNEVTFTNTRTDDKWLDGDSWCNNIFK